MNDARYCENPDLKVSYLYEEGDERERLDFEKHLRSCERCSSELAGLRTVRADVTAWTPPETVLGFRIVREPVPARSRWAWLRPPAMPAWAQLAAASLVIGVAVGLSGLEVRYDANGLAVRTGWSQPAATRAAATVPVAAAVGAEAPWRADLVAFQEQMRNELHQTVPASGPTAIQPAVSGGGKGMNDAEFMARVRQLIEASETRTQREMALRLAQVVRDFDTQRRADMTRVADGLGVLEGRTGAAVAQQRELMNYLVRVSQRQQ
jgi:hypothetical protein